MKGLNPYEKKHLLWEHKSLLKKKYFFNFVNLSKLNNR